MTFQHFSAKTFGLSRFDADTPKDFAPGQFQRDQGGVAILLGM